MSENICKICNIVPAALLVVLNRKKKDPKTIWVCEDCLLYHTHEVSEVLKSE